MKRRNASKLQKLNLDSSKNISNRSAALLSKNAIQLLVCLVPVIYTVFFILRIAVHPAWTLWDFESNYYHTKAFLHGLNPYDFDFKTFPHTQPLYQFVYTPLSLIFFAPFTLLDYADARIAALIFYVIVLFTTFIAFSRRLITKNCFGAFFCLFAILAFNGAICKSIQSGNVASLETALIFLSFICWLRGHHVWFLCFIFAASIFKLTPLFFLVLIFFDKTPQWKSTFIAMVVFLIALAISILAMPYEVIPYASSNISWCMPIVRGFQNPSMFCLLTTVIEQCHFPAVKPLINAVFIIWVAAILFFTVRSGLFLAREGRDTARVDAVVLALLCYALVVPRFQDYAWVIMIPAVFRVLMDREYAKTIGPLMVLCLLPNREDNLLPGLTEVFRIAKVYSPIIVAFGAWLLLVLGIAKRPASKLPTGC